jgi:hypothetical protein
MRKANIYGASWLSWAYRRRSPQPRTSIGEALTRFERVALAREEEREQDGPFDGPILGRSERNRIACAPIAAVRRSYRFPR